MNVRHDLERRIADHYATEAPSRAPEWLLARALDTVDTTPQRRTWLGRPWMIPPMRPVAGLVVGGIAIVAITASGLTVLRQPAVGPAAPSSPSALPPPLTERFDSTFNGISIDHPAGWQVRPATEPWTSQVLTFIEPGVDIISDPTLGAGLYMAVASEPLGDRPYREWAASIVGFTSLCDDDVPELWEGHTLSLDPWIPHAYVSCARSVWITTDTRGYAVVLHVADEGLAGTYNDAWFQSVLDTLDLHADASAEAANPAPSASVGPSDGPP